MLSCRAEAVGCWAHIWAGGLGCPDSLPLRIQLRVEPRAQHLADCPIEIKARGASGNALGLTAGSKSSAALPAWRPN